MGEKLGGGDSTGTGDWPKGSSVLLSLSLLLSWTALKQFRHCMMNVLLKSEHKSGFFVGFFSHFVCVSS